MYFHPQDTVENYQNQPDHSFDHLWYHVHYFQQKDFRKSESKDRLRPLLESITLSPAHRDTLARIRKRRFESLAMLSRQSRVQILRAVPAGTWVHGMGAAHVRESSISLHPVYGVPYLPGSSVKGMVYHWSLQAFFEGNEERLKNALDACDEDKEVALVILDIFGDQDFSGLIQFHDAFVSEQLSLKPDVLTVHYKDYYEGKTPPTDNLSPVPNAFYVVDSPYVEFVLTQSLRRKTRKSSLSEEELMVVAGAWLQRALSETGIGSKTTSGYGYFREFRDCTEEVLTEILHGLRQQEAARRAREEAEKRAAEERRRREALENALSQMTAGERLAFQIQQLTDSPEDQEKSKAMFDEIIQMGEQGDLAPAKALKEYWQRTGNWKVKKQQKKQLEKVGRLKQLLGE